MKLNALRIPIFAISFLLGTCCIYFFSTIPGLLSISGILFVVLMLGFLCRQYLLRLILFALTAGFIWGMWHAFLIISQQLPEQLQGKDLLIIGRIVSLPEYQDRHVGFIFEIDQIESPQLKHIKLKKIRLNWYNDYPALDPDQQWRLQVRLKKPHGMQNPGGFDYEKWLFQQRIRATGYVVAGSHNQLIASNTISINIIRKKLAAAIDKALPDNAMAALIKGLTIGERSSMSTEQWQILQATGTSHLLAISGLHIGLVAAVTGFIFTLLWRIFPPLLLRLPASHAGSIAALIAAVIYSALAGFTVPTQRALIMLLVFIVALINRKQWSLWHSYWLALLMVLIIDPLNVLAMGFWLSFSAVAILLYGLTGKLQQQNKFYTWGKAQIIVFIGLFSITVLFFQKVSLIAPLANLVAIPWVGFIIVPLNLLASGLALLSENLAHNLWQLSAYLLDILWSCLAWTVNFNFYWWHDVNMMAFIISIIAIAVLLAPRGFPARYLALFMLMPLFSSNFNRPIDDNFWVSILDVGQGLAIVVQTKDHNLLYDTGAKFSERFDMGQTVIAPFLLKQSISQLDTVIISHHHNDHMGGLAAIMENFEVKQLLSSEQLPYMNTHICKHGYHWHWNGIDFTILHPDPTFTGSINDRSCVIKISNNRHTVLLTGDIESRAEQYLLDNEIIKQPVNLLLVPHHGSKSSSSQHFIAMLSPKLAIVSAGYLNRYRMPHDIVLQRYQEKGIPVLNTADSGMIQIKFDGYNNPTLEQYRYQNSHIWHH